MVCPYRELIQFSSNQYPLSLSECPVCFSVTAVVKQWLGGLMVEGLSNTLFKHKYNSTGAVPKLDRGLWQRLIRALYSPPRCDSIHWFICSHHHNINFDHHIIFFVFQMSTIFFHCRAVHSGLICIDPVCCALPRYSDMLMDFNKILWSSWTEMMYNYEHMSISGYCWRFISRCIFTPSMNWHT